MWNKLKGVMANCVDYFHDHLVFTAVIGVCALLVLIAIIALIVKGAKKRKYVKVQAENAKLEAKQKAEAEAKAKAEAEAAEKARIEEEAAKAEAEAKAKAEAEEKRKAEEAARIKAAAEAKAKAEAEAKLRAEAEAKAQAEAEAKAKAEAEAEAKAKAEAEEKAKAEAKAAETETKATKKKTAKAEPKSSGRYAGKWVVCRLVTAPSGDTTEIQEPTEEAFFFELHASNGEKLLASEEYTTYNGAIAGITTHKTNIANDNFRITLSKKGDYIFKLLNGKNMLLCMGEHYATRARCESAIESAKRFAKTALLDENIHDIVIPAPTEDETEEITTPADGYNGKWIIRNNVAEDGEQVFYFELFASNGEKLLSSEEYTTYVGAMNGIETHKTNIEKNRFRISLTKHGDYIYKLLNGNNQLLCLGEHYKTRRRCQSAIESVKRFAKNAPILTDSDTLNK